jgi:ferrochelatase
MTKTAIILFNLGGPDQLSSVKPFLFNLFNDKAIINLVQPFRFLLAKLIASWRCKKASDIYRQLDGKSLLAEITGFQGIALERQLIKSGDFRVFTAMRYWHPFSFEIIDEVLEYEPNQVILLPLYPQFSTTTSKSSIDDFIAHFNKRINQNNSKIIVKSICCYPTHPDFIMSHARLLKETIKNSGQNLEDFLKNFRILFSAHGLPQKIIDKGDPYVYQVEKTLNATVEKLKELFKDDGKEIGSNLDFKLCFQSKVGLLKWTSPSLATEIKRAALDKKSLIIVPIAFVSDHSETLIELDIEYKKLATDLGIKDYFRVRALNVDAYFIDGLIDLCLKAINNNSDNVISGSHKRLCPASFCQCINRNY